MKRLTACINHDPTQPFYRRDYLPLRNMIHAVEVRAFGPKTLCTCHTNFGWKYLNFFPAATSAALPMANTTQWLLCPPLLPDARRRWISRYRPHCVGITRRAGGALRDMTNGNDINISPRWSVRVTSKWGRSRWIDGDGFKAVAGS